MYLPLLKELVEKRLHELIVRGDASNAQHFVNVDKYLWLLSDESVPPDAQRALGVSDVDDFYDLQGELDPSSATVLIGDIHDDYLYVYQLGSFHRDPKSSVVIQKIVKQLGLQGSKYTAGESEVETEREEVLGKIPDVAYHGTTTEYLRSLLKLGLKPGEKETNYPQVISVSPGFLQLMDSTVYFSTRFDEAVYHATHTTEQVGRDSDPVVIELRIPDKNKLVTDFDVKREVSPERKPFSQSKEVGVYGFRGRVPASHFTSFHVAMNASAEGEIAYLEQDSFTELDLDQVNRYLESKEEVGYGNPEYDPSDYDEEEYD